MTRLSTVLWFDGRAEAAAHFYAGLFGGTLSLTVRGTGDGPIAPGAVAGVGLEAGGLSIVALNAPGGAPFPLGGAMMAEVEDQGALDRLWDGLLADGGEAMMCGWLRDRFGVTWQLVPPDMAAMLADPAPQAASRVTRAMLGMVKLDIAALRAAHKGEV